MKQEASGGAGKRFFDYLSERDNRHEIESALAVEFLLENPEQEHAGVYEQAMAVWEHMRVAQPELGEIKGSDTASPSAITVFSAPTGERISMKVEVCRGKVRLRSMRGSPRDRKAMEARWKGNTFPGAFLRKVSLRHQAGRRQATIQG